MSLEYSRKAFNANEEGIKAAVAHKDALIDVAHGEAIEENEARGEMGREKEVAVENASSFDELFALLDSLADKNGAIHAKGSNTSLSVHNTKVLINAYREGKQSISTNDVFRYKNYALENITRSYGLRQKVFELLMKEGSGKFVNVRGEEVGREDIEKLLNY